MAILSKSIKVFLLLLSIMPALGAAEPAPLPDPREVAEAEKNFARDAIEHGIRASFLQFFADDSIIFTPAPVNGKAWYMKYEDKNRELIWRPVFATISGAGDIGVTTGPWEMKKETPFAFGQFVSIWKKQADNSWKVLVDIGVDHPQPTNPVPKDQFIAPNDAPQIDEKSRRQALEKAETAFNDALKTDAGRALSDWAGENIRIFRENSFPVVGQIAAKTMLASEHGKVTLKILGNGTSQSGDLAYQYGSYFSKRDLAAEFGYYLTIWKLDGAGQWTILIDLQKKSVPVGVLLRFQPRLAISAFVIPNPALAG